ncbi:MAG TPA: MarR family transcriptional regulator [Longimicrobiales bacterium]|nr:MarR family transcriptional regulator [Longimicrobiales bacterium]
MARKERVSGGTPRLSRRECLEELARVGREHSDATVLFHGTVASLLDLHPTDYKVLGILERSGPLSAGEIARKSGLATASVTNLIDRLERKGFVRRVADPADRRRVMVEVVADRLTGADSVFDSARHSLARLFDRYSDHDLWVIADFLRHNAERLRAETGRLAAAASATKERPRPAEARPRNVRVPAADPAEHR